MNQSEHLNTPRLIADSTGATVWRHDNTEPFADSVPDENPSGLGPFEFPLRRSGEYADRESGLFQNYFRDFNPATDTFLRSDPIGLRGGLNTYARVRDPLRGTDPLGLTTYMCHKPLKAFGGFDSGTSKSFDSYIPNMVNPFYHQFLCVVRPDGSSTCGGHDTATGLPVGPGAPSEDTYPYNRPDLCEQKSDDSCVEICVTKEIADPNRPAYGILWGMLDCQEWSDMILKKCQRLCKGRGGKSPYSLGVEG